VTDPEQRAPTDPAPPPDDLDTDRGGHAPLPPEPAGLLSPQAQSDLLVRLVYGVEEMGRDLRATRRDVRLILEEGRTHARRLTELEARLAGLPCQRGDGCPCPESEPEKAAE